MEIPVGITRIGIEAFEGCTGIKEVKSSDGITEFVIEEKAFYNCTNLQTINIPKTTKRLTTP